MKLKSSVAILFLLAFSAAPVFAASPQPAAEPVPSYDQAPDVQFGSVRAGNIVPLPPHLQPYVPPSGAPNLDYDWIEDGGARLYWNYVIIPQQLRMDGASWRDPALVPQLLPQKTPVRVVYRTRRPAAATTARRATPPANVASTSLRAPATPSPAIPLPVTPVPPLRAAQSPESVPPVTPPRLQ